MSWKTRRKGKPKQIGLKFREKTLFFTAKHKYLSDIVDLTSVKGAETAHDELVKAFNNAKTRTKKRRIKQATVSAANRAGVGAQNPNVSQKKREEYKQIQEIYQEAHKKMILPPRKGLGKTSY